MQRDRRPVSAAVPTRAPQNSAPRFDFPRAGRAYALPMTDFTEQGRDARRRRGRPRRRRGDHAPRAVDGRLGDDHRAPDGHLRRPSRGRAPAGAARASGGALHVLSGEPGRRRGDHFRWEQLRGRDRHLRVVGGHVRRAPPRASSSGYTFATAGRKTVVLTVVGPGGQHQSGARTSRSPRRVMFDPHDVDDLPIDVEALDDDRAGQSRLQPRRGRSRDVSDTARIHSAPIAHEHARVRARHLAQLREQSDD